mgnify:CR=1 FL=1
MHLKSLENEQHEHCVATLCDILQAGPKRSLCLRQKAGPTSAPGVGRRNGSVGSCVAVGPSGSASGTAVAGCWLNAADPTGIVGSSNGAHQGRSPARAQAGRTSSRMSDDGRLNRPARSRPHGAPTIRSRMDRRGPTPRENSTSLERRAPPTASRQGRSRLWSPRQRPQHGRARARPRVSFDIISGKKTRRCRADIGLARRIGAGAAACEGRASRRKRQRPIKLAGIHLRQRAALDPSDGAQGEQQRGLKAVACPDGIHHIDRGRLDLRPDPPLCAMPGLP